MKTTKLEAANAALYAAAEKAGMRADLARAQVEVEICGDSKMVIVWERELCEDESFVIPRAAIARAEAWLAKYAATV